MRRMKWGIGAAGVVGVAWLLVNVFNLDLGGVGGGGDERLGLPEPAPQSAPAHDSVPAEPPVQSEPETVRKNCTITPAIRTSGRTLRATRTTRS